jgi:hypothetical protein
LEPPASEAEFTVLTAINVSLWGPHSFDASTFVLALIEVDFGALPPIPFWSSV